MYNTKNSSQRIPPKEFIPKNPLEKFLPKNSSMSDPAYYIEDCRIFNFITF